MLAHSEPASCQMPRRDDTAVIRRLRDERRRLQLEIAELASRLAPLGRLPACLDLSSQEARIIRCMLSLDWCVPETLYASLYYDEGEGTAGIKTVDVLICKSRQVLARYGIEIETSHRRGHRMTPRNKAKVLQLCLAEAEATGRSIAEYSRIDMKIDVWMPPKYNKFR